MITVHFAKILDNAVILKLKHHYFHCKAWQTNLVPKHCTISNPTRQVCLEKLTEPVDLKHITNELATSNAFVGRQYYTDTLNVILNRTFTGCKKLF